MELRHLRYFVAVAEEQSLSVAAEQRLHTAQPSLSRQMQDLELEVGVPLMTRHARGIELTPSGRAFLEHARFALSAVEAAVEAARRADQRAKPCFSIGFLTGHEMRWMPAALQILRVALPNIDVMVSSRLQQDLIDGLHRGNLDVAICRRMNDAAGLVFRLLATEPLVAVLPSDHRLAANESIDVHELVGETFISVSHTAPALRTVIDEYLERSGVDLPVSYELDNAATMAMSLIISTRGVALLPKYAEDNMPQSVVSRPLRGEIPTIDLVLSYRKSNTSPALMLLLSRLDELVERVAVFPNELA
jgi:LysR family hca operon transcriptional activator